MIPALARAWFPALLLVRLAVPDVAGAAPWEVSGVYPHLAMFNDEGECGVGAVVPWAGHLWVVTYAPHAPRGDRSNKLYAVTPDLRQIIRPESVGGTPANRMIHAESGQLFIGPYAIREDGEVRAISPGRMFGRPTGNARHLTDPARKILYATMEEGIYEVDVDTLEVVERWRDEQLPGGRKADLPGYHGKGFYSGQGVYVYANNGEHGKEALRRPDVPSGILAEWDGTAEAWTRIRRQQFTEVTGPGGLRGNADPASDPIWAVGWDSKSLVLGVRLPETGWTFYRLPKGSHSYDGAHGWNTEWPRIREIGEEDFLMTMHGTFWRFPAGFRPGNSAGILPRSNYLKVIGDVCRWNDRLVLGCDDTAKSEFLNKRRAKGTIAAPQSQSNLWFVDPDRLDHLGPVIGRGAVWRGEAVTADVPSDPFLFSGYDLRALFLRHDAARPVGFRAEVDRSGDGVWTPLRRIEALPGVATFVPFAESETGAWIRLVPEQDLGRVDAEFTFRDRDPRSPDPAPLADGLARPGEGLTGGLLRARDGNRRTLSFLATDADGEIGLYELDGEGRLRPTQDEALRTFTRENAAIPAGVLEVDAASVVYTDDAGRRWRLPKGDAGLERHPLGEHRIAREVATERDLFHAQGTFYELPAENAGGFAKVRPVATHNRLIHDFCSYRGLFVASGVAREAPDQPRVIRSEDGRVALWTGVIDDLWQFGKPRGVGGPWKETSVTADVPSDPYLMTGYDRKTLRLSADRPVTVTAEIDLTGDGGWAVYRSFSVAPDAPVEHAFHEAFSAYWIRFRSASAGLVSAQLTYE